MQVSCNWYITPNLCSQVIPFQCCKVHLIDVAETFSWSQKKIESRATSSLRQGLGIYRGSAVCIPWSKDRQSMLTMLEIITTIQIKTCFHGANPRYPRGFGQIVGMQVETLQGSGFKVAFLHQRSCFSCAGAAKYLETVLHCPHRTTSPRTQSPHLGLQRLFFPTGLRTSKANVLLN